MYLIFLKVLISFEMLYVIFFGFVDKLEILFFLIFSISINILKMCVVL